MSRIPALIRLSTALSLLLLVLAFPTHVLGQFQDWRTHTSFRPVVDLTASSDAIWAATEGGVYRYGVPSGEISRFTTTEGLTGLDITAITYDAVNDAVWVGYSDGVLDRIDVASNTIRSFLDIPRATQFPDREISKLITTGDTLVVATGFGIVLFDPNRGEVIETYSRFGGTISVGFVTDIAITTIPDGVRRLWATITNTEASDDTPKAIVSAPLGAANLQDPLAWDTELVSSGNLNLNAIAGFGDQLYVGTENGIFIRDGVNQYRLLDVTSGNVRSFLPLSDQLIAVEQQVLLALRPEGNRRVGSGGLFFLESMVLGPGR